jgi:hypothetical protein
MSIWLNPLICTRLSEPERKCLAGSLFQIILNFIVITTCCQLVYASLTSNEKLDMHIMYKVLVCAFATCKSHT